MSSPAALPDGVFEFGKNWSRFFTVVDERHVAASVASLQRLLKLDSLYGLTLLDAGCGSGLHSLAAVRMGATVRSFDYDPDAVTCSIELRQRFSAASAPWTIEQGSVIDSEYLARLGMFDVVYSWGVLQHTGAMCKAMELLTRCVKPRGLLAVALYNDQGLESRVWRVIKRTYNRLPGRLRPLLVVLVGFYFECRSTLRRLIRRRPPLLEESVQGPRARGMSKWHDLVDWVGGYPFEVAKREDVIAFYRERGFELISLCSVGKGLGCNEFVFRRI